MASPESKRHTLEPEKPVEQTVTPPVADATLETVEQEKPKQQPSVGRVVHFVYGGVHVPALITDAATVYREPGKPDLEAQALTVFPVSSPPFTTIALFDSASADATWHWPEFVPAK